MEADATVIFTASQWAELVEGPGPTGKGQAEEQKHDRGRSGGEDGWAATEGREQLQEVRQHEYHNCCPPINIEFGIHMKRIKAVFTH